MKSSLMKHRIFPLEISMELERCNDVPCFSLDLNRHMAKSTKLTAQKRRIVTLKISTF